MKKPSKPRQPIPGVAIIGLSITFVCLVFAGIVAWFLYPIVFRDDIENRIRIQLETEIANLPIPPNCHESERKYQRSGLDTVSTWYIDYDCDTTGATAHNVIVTQLKTQKFWVINDYSVPRTGQQGASYVFSLGKEHFRLDYVFKPDVTIDLGAQSIEELHNSKVTKIYVSLTRQ